MSLPISIRDTLRPGFLPLETNNAILDIRPAANEFQHNLANSLVHLMYARRGYKNMPTVGYEANNPNRMTLVAWRGDKAAATLTLLRDSPAGLLADENYAKEINALRRSNRVFCEVTRLAVCPDSSSSGLLQALFQSAMFYGFKVFAANDVLIEVNPRHAKYYRNLYGFRKIGGIQHCQRVNAPAVLLHQELGNISKAAKRFR